MLDLIQHIILGAGAFLGLAACIILMIDLIREDYRNDE
jgi:hypothetical protein